jgi:hypothetical protein
VPDLAQFALEPIQLTKRLPTQLPSRFAASSFSFTFSFPQNRIVVREAVIDHLSLVRISLFFIQVALLLKSRKLLWLNHRLQQEIQPYYSARLNY